MSCSILQKYICISGEGGDGGVEVALSSPSLHSRDIVKVGQELLEVQPSSASTEPNCCCKKVNSEQGQVPPQHIEHMPHAVFWLFLVFTRNRIIGLSENQTDYSSFQGNGRFWVDGRKDATQWHPNSNSFLWSHLLKIMFYYVPEGCLLVNMRHLKKKKFILS